MRETDSLRADETLKWSWLESGRMKNNCTYYDQAQVVRSSDGARRVYVTGDTVFVANDEEQMWIGQIVEMYERGVYVEDEECQVISESFKESAQMRCTFRWFYNANDESIADSQRVSPHIPAPVDGEIYFSDHVEFRDTNSLEVIEGRAFLCSTEGQMMRWRERCPTGFWKGDVIRLVRCFYGYNSGNPPPIRELVKGELDVYLQNPSVEPDLYNKSRMTLYGRHGAVMKGTRRKKRFQYEDDPDLSVALSISDISAIDDRDNIKAGVLTKFTPISRQQGICSPTVETSSISKMDRHGGKRCLIEDSRSPGDIKKKRGNPGHAEIDNTPSVEFALIDAKQGSFQPFDTERIWVCESVKESWNEMKKESPHRGGKSAIVNILDFKEMAGAWENVRESLAKGTREQQEYIRKHLTEVLNMLLKYMKEHKLKFNMDDKSIMAVSESIARTFFALSSHNQGTNDLEMRAPK